MYLGTRLFVGNVPLNTTEKELDNIFSDYGNVTNVELKYKDGVDGESKGFAFVTLNGANQHIESCINTVSKQDYKGVKLYITRARESFMERLKRERAEAEEKKKPEFREALPEPPQPIKTEKPFTPVAEKKRKSIQENDSPWEKPGPKKIRIFDDLGNSTSREPEIKHIGTKLLFKDEKKKEIKKVPESRTCNVTEEEPKAAFDERKLDSDKKRLESIRNMKKAYIEKKNLIKIGLSNVDKVSNQKIVFSDGETDSQVKVEHTINRNLHHDSKINRKPANVLFNDEDDEGSDEEPTFEIKKQFEGQKGQKLLELQNRYKSDKRFALDQRFMQGDDDGDEETEDQAKQGLAEDGLEPSAEEEKAKQYKILEDVLGVSIHNSHSAKPSPGVAEKRKGTAKLGMLRFDPSRPDHTKFVTADITSKSTEKKSKKERKKERAERAEIEKEEYKAAAAITPAVQVSDEKFYKVSDNLKDSLAQSNGFSLRRLFGGQNTEEEPQTNDIDEPVKNQSTTIKSKKTDKVRNPFDKPQKNPFKYDSSDSEPDDEDTLIEDAEAKKASEQPPKAVWKEPFFFTEFDSRLIEGLAFFNNTDETNFAPREELKHVMTKRVQHFERNMQMFKGRGNQRPQNGNNRQPYRPYQRNNYY